MTVFKYFQGQEGRAKTNGNHTIRWMEIELKL